MTTATDSPEIRLLKASNRALLEENAALSVEIEDLRGRLDELRYLTPSPYDQAPDLLTALEVQLPGWPARRWRELARLIEEGAP